MSVTVGYVANRQNGMMRNRNVNYGQLGGGSASQPFFPLGITSAMNVFSPDGKVKYDSLQLSMNRRMSDGVQFTAAYTAAKGGTGGSAASRFPSTWDLNKGNRRTTAQAERVAGLRLPFGPGRKWLSDDGLAAKLAGGWQVNAFVLFQRVGLVSVTSNSNVLNAPGTTTQFADQVTQGPVEIYGPTMATWAPGHSTST